MILLFVVLVVIASVAIGLFILVQNPKGGGLSGSIAGFNSQFMGVKQTTDVLEKGTWIMAIAIGLLCLFSSFFIPKGTVVNTRQPVNATPNNTPQPSNPDNSVPFNSTTPPAN